jgi:hypothetical protein
MRQHNQDPVDPKKLAGLDQSAEAALSLIADLLRNRPPDAANDLHALIEAISAQLEAVDIAATYAHGRVEAALAGEELTVSDVQLLSAFASETAAANTESLRKSGRIDAARRQVNSATGTFPGLPVLVMSPETSTLGVGEDHGAYLADASCVLVVPEATDHTLRHELVHATQPPQVGDGPFARIKMIEGVTDALALEAGSDPDHLSYAKDAAAVVGWGEAVSRDRLEWLRELNCTSTPEIVMGETLKIDGKAACEVFFDAEFAAEGVGREFDHRVAAARAAVQDRLAVDRAEG